MRKNTKKIIPVVALSAVAIAGLVGINGVLADDNEDPRPLSEKIAEYFNLNVDNVEEFFEKEREERQAEMQARHEERLSQLVEDGKITEDQKQLVLEKQAEMRENMGVNRENHEPGEMRDMTQEERDAEREERQSEAEERRAEMEQWLEDNGINVDLMSELGLFGGPGGGGHRGGFVPGYQND